MVKVKENTKNFIKYRKLVLIYHIQGKKYEYWEEGSGCWGPYTLVFHILLSYSSFFDINYHGMLIYFSKISDFMFDKGSRKNRFFLVARPLRT